MLGWNIGVYRQKNSGKSPATFGAEHGTRLAVWQTNSGGLNWIDELVEQQKAISLGGNGYPCEYTSMATYIIPSIRKDPPSAKAVWSFDSGDILLSGWEGKTVISLENIDACRPDEWLIIQAWDES